MVEYRIDRNINKAAPWIVLVNGLFADMDSWEGVCSILSHDFNILRFNGAHQGSYEEGAASITLESSVRSLENLIESCKLSCFYLLGLSNGGRVALEYSRRNKSKVLGLVAADTYHELTPLLKLKITSWLKANQVGGSYHRFDIATPWVWGETFLNSNTKAISTYREKAGGIPLRSVEALLGLALEDRKIDIAKIETPTLILVGEEDLLTPPFLHQEISRMIPHSKLKIVPGGHASLLEFPQTIKEIVLPFIYSLINNNQIEAY